MRLCGSGSGCSTSGTILMTHVTSRLMAGCTRRGVSIQACELYAWPMQLSRKPHAHRKQRLHACVPCLALSVVESSCPNPWPSHVTCVRGAGGPCVAMSGRGRVRTSSHIEAARAGIELVTACFTVSPATLHASGTEAGARSAHKVARFAPVAYGSCLAKDEALIAAGFRVGSHCFGNCRLLDRPAHGHAEPHPAHP